MSYLRLYGISEQPDDFAYYDRFACRENLIEYIAKIKHFDLIVVGGGIHGACFARQAAFNGLSTLLLERSDYSGATSSRSSKMAHGGLRYLELYDFAQVFEGIKAREDLFRTAPHLVKPERFLIPVEKKDLIFRYKLKLGLLLYDLFVSQSERRHRWLSLEKLSQTELAQSRFQLSGAFSYVDGILDDSRLVLENITAARQEGAFCLNYADVFSCSRAADSRMVVQWRDVLTRTQHEVTSGVVVNCTGPWVPEMGRLAPSALAERVRFSRGTHLLFRRPWKGPSLFLPLGERSRYYFVWPHFSGTMVGTTEREVDTLEPDPQPSGDEVEEILDRLKMDLPESGLTRETLHYAFAGVRTLPLRKSAEGETAVLSRKHLWSFSGGVLSLLGGKLTTALWTVHEGLALVYKLANLHMKLVPLKGRMLPGAGLYESVHREFEQRCAAAGVESDLTDFALGRFGSRVRLFSEDDAALLPLAPRISRAMIEYAVKYEQAETIEDLLRRRLGLEYFADHGLEKIEQVGAVLQELRPQADVAGQIEEYRRRLINLHDIMRVPFHEPPTVAR